MKTVGVAVYAIVMIVFGAVCVGWPKAVRNGVVKFDERHPGLDKWNPLRSFVREPAMLINLRLVGLLALLAGFILLAVVFFGKPVETVP